MAAQEPLVKLAESISKLSQSAEGLGGIQLDVPRRSLDLYWKGAMPDAVREQITGMARADNLAINIGSAKYSKAELIKISRSVAQNRGSYPGFVFARPSVDGSGIVVGLTSVENVGRLRFPDDTKVVKSGEFVPTFSRAADTPPWWAGAVIRGSVLCSSGFAAFRDKTVGIITAKHCGPAETTYFAGALGSPSANLVIGKAEDPKHHGGVDVMDAVWINTPALASPVIYDGGVGGTEFSKHVVGKHGVYPGMLLCVSGAFTGANCGMIVRQIDQITALSEGVAVASPDDPNQVSVGTGDSGGPVFTLWNNPAEVTAAGMVIGGQNGVPCTGPGAACLNEMWFIDIPNLELFLNVSIATQPPS